MRNKFLAWCVHLYTATGLVAAAGMAVLIIRGGDESFRAAILLMILATFIDSTDGTLARRVRVTKWTPGFDGRRLDDITDFHTYTSLPLFLVWRAGILPGEQAWWLLIPLLASAYGFSQTDAKTEDGYFLGFPSYWNAIAFYLYFLRPPAAVALGVILLFSLLTFVPSRYLYPSYGGLFSRTTILLSALWGSLLVLIVTGVFEDTRAMVWASLAFPIYYLAVSWSISFMLTQRRRGAEAER